MHFPFTQRLSFVLLVRRIRAYFDSKKGSRKNEKRFRREIREFIKLDGGQKMKFDDRDLYPCLDEDIQTTRFDSHYIYHPAWAIRIVQHIKPEKHIDFSSTLSFCSTLSAQIPTEFYDLRPAALTLSNLKCGQADLTNLPFPSNTIRSLSCMHTIEHIGLGRFGDPIDPLGDVKAINELKRVTARGGDLLVVTPVGKPCIKFNAHRIYSFEIIMEYFSGFKLQDFSLVLDDGSFVNNADPVLVADQYYGCGCFWFKKPL